MCQILVLILCMSFLSSYASDYTVEFTYQKAVIDHVEVPRNSAWLPTQSTYEINQPYNSFTSRTFQDLATKKNSAEVRSFWEQQLVPTIADNVDGVFFLYNRICSIGARKKLAPQEYSAHLLVKIALNALMAKDLSLQKEIDIPSNNSKKIAAALNLLDEHESPNIFPLYDALFVVKAVEKHFVMSQIPALIRKNVSPAMKAVLFPTIQNRLYSWYASLGTRTQTFLKWLTGTSVAVGTAGLTGWLYSNRSAAAYGKLPTTNMQ